MVVTTRGRWWLPPSPLKFYKLILNGVFWGPESESAIKKILGGMVVTPKGVDGGYHHPPPSCPWVIGSCRPPDIYVKKVT